MTDVPLQEYLEAKLDSIQEQIAHTAIDLNRRLEAMNDFRAQIQSERGEYVRRDALDIMLTDLTTRLQHLERWLAMIVGGALVMAASTGVLMWSLNRP